MIGVEQNYVHASSQIMLLHPINMFVCCLIGGGGVLLFLVRDERNAEMSLNIIVF